MINLTAVEPTAAGYLAAVPGTGTPKTVSNVNFLAGQIVPNLVVVPLGDDGTIAVRNGPGATDVVIDVVGWYT